MGRTPLARQWRKEITRASECNIQPSPKRMPNKNGKVGTRVLIHSLVKAKQYNKKYGTIKAMPKSGVPEDRKDGRWQVAMDAGDHVWVKTENLTIIPPPPAGTRRRLFSLKRRLLRLRHARRI